VWADKLSLETFKCVVKYDTLERLSCGRNYPLLKRKWCSILNCVDLCGGTNMIQSPERLGFYHPITSLQQDVWALGCLFFQLITGVLLFDEQAQKLHTTSLSYCFIFISL
jgi:serine/threonine protein kinase